MHLVLLVGKNPLQAYITARFYAEKNNDGPGLKGTWLVHSTNESGGYSGTLQYAKALEKMLSRPNQGNFGRIRLVPLLDIENGAEIEREIWCKLQREISEEVVHLDYTGGTKAMGVHIFRALEQMTTDQGKFEYSYLSARDFKIHSFSRSNQPKPLSNDLREIIKLSRDEILELHLYMSEDPKEQGENGFSDALVQLERAIEKGEISIFLKWCKEFLRGLYPTEKCREKVKTFVDSLTDELKGSFQKSLREFPLVMDVLSKLPKEYSILNEKGELWIPQEGEVSNTEFKKRVKESWSFLDGKWLERYINLLLKKLLPKEIGIYKDFKGRKSTHEEAKDFEMDGLIIRGYQVFGISITTSRESGICKNKGFEILHRSAEIGGDESKGILITGLNEENIRKTQEDLNTITNQKKGKILVLGLEDWKQEILSSKIKDFIFQ